MSYCEKSLKINFEHYFKGKLIFSLWLNSMDGT